MVSRPWAAMRAPKNSARSALICTWAVTAGTAIFPASPTGMRAPHVGLGRVADQGGQAVFETGGSRGDSVRRKMDLGLVSERAKGAGDERGADGRPADN